MGLFARILGGVPRSEWRGIDFDLTRPFWEVSGHTTWPALLRALVTLLPNGCILYFEDGSPSGQLAEFLKKEAIPEQAHVAHGTIWPTPRVDHLPATPAVMMRLAELMESRAEAEL